MPRPPRPRKKRWARGWCKYSFAKLKLHVYLTADPMNDACFALETDKNLVAIESPPFSENIVLWQQYLKSLNKPLSDVLLSYHPNGGQWYGQARSHATLHAETAMREGSTKDLTLRLSQSFGPSFSTDIAGINSVMREGANTIGGIDFIIADAENGYTVAIPAINAIYIHMLGADSHSILAGAERAQGYLKLLQGIKAKGYSLILSSHHRPEGKASLTTKIAYVKRALKIAGASKNKEEFTAKMKAAFPNYLGLNYLDMTAGYMFPAK